MTIEIRIIGSVHAIHMAPTSAIESVFLSHVEQMVTKGAILHARKILEEGKDPVVVLEVTDKA